jgi:hypothetical protein
VTLDRSPRSETLVAISAIDLLGEDEREGEDISVGSMVFLPSIFKTANSLRTKRAGIGLLEVKGKKHEVSRRTHGDLLSP